MVKAIDMCGKKFGKLVVIERYGNSKKGEIIWRCQCDCGNETFAWGTSLRKGTTRSCGCISKNDKIIDLTGKRFGILTVICRDESTNKGKVKWLCKCDCGNQKSVIGNNLTQGTTKSCGCIQKEKFIKVTSKHKKSKTRLYGIWTGIKKRSNNINNINYEQYGGRGIHICVEWENDFNAFYEWAIINGYDDNLTIDRIDNDKGYTADNCRWVNRKKQGNNKRNNLYIEFNGIIKTLSEWSDEFDINANTLCKI